MSSADHYGNLISTYLNRALAADNRDDSEGVIRNLASAANVADRALIDHELTVEEADSLADRYNNILAWLENIRVSSGVNRVSHDTFGPMVMHLVDQRKLGGMKNNPRAGSSVTEINDWRLLKKQHPTLRIRSKRTNNGVLGLGIWGKNHVVPLWFKHSNPDIAYWQNELNKQSRAEYPIWISTSDPEYDDKLRAFKAHQRLILHDMDLDPEMPQMDKDFLNQRKYWNPKTGTALLDMPYNLVRASYRERMISTIVGGVVGLLALWWYNKS